MMNVFLLLSLAAFSAFPCIGGSYSKKYHKKNRQQHHQNRTTKGKRFLHWDASKGFLIDRLYAKKSPFSEVNQGQRKTNPFQSLVRTCKLFDQFTMLASFDVVLFNQRVAAGIADKKMEQRGLSLVERNQELDRLQQALSTTSILYVLADVRDEKYGRLTDKNTQWRFLLKDSSSQLSVAPQRIAAVDLEAEARLMFGDNWAEVSAFKTLYRIEFPKLVKSDDLGACSLVISSPLVSDEIVWSGQFVS